MSAITTPKKVFEYKLKHPLELKYFSLESIYERREIINNDLELHKYEGPRDEVPAYTQMYGRNKITCEYILRLLQELKKEVLVDLRKEYPDCGECSVTYLANFEYPLIKSKICDKAIITVIHEDIDKNAYRTHITRYLDVVLI